MDTAPADPWQTKTTVCAYSIHVHVYMYLVIQNNKRTDTANTFKLCINSVIEINSADTYTMHMQILHCTVPHSWQTLDL